MHSLTSAESNGDVKSKERAQRAWASKLQRWGLAGLVSALLESSGAFATLAAQSLYIGQPILESWMPAESLAELLDDPQQTQSFVKLLRENEP